MVKKGLLKAWRRHDEEEGEEDVELRDNYSAEQNRVPGLAQGCLSDPFVLWSTVYCGG